MLLSAAVLLAGGAEALRGQSGLDGFDPNANSLVRVVVVQPDGKVLIGGDFTTLSPNGGGAVTRNHIARLNPDGTLDTAFDPNANLPVHSIALQADGKILAGGDFNGANSIGGQPRNFIARLDATTGLPDSFDPNANNGVFSIAVQADGKILAGGFFNGPNSIGGQTRNYIARLNATTGLADSLDSNANNTVLSIVVQADGKILVGGQFTTIGGQTRNRIARLNATTGLADSFDPDANSSVRSIAMQADGRILAGGEFTAIGGQSRNYIARLSNTGVVDSFDLNGNSFVYSIALQADGRILAGGSFTTLAPNGGISVTRNRIARLEVIGPANPVVYEGFDTPSTGTLTGQSGTSSFGWTGTWGRGGSSSDAQVVAGTLAAPANTAGFYTVPPAANYAQAVLGAQGVRTIDGSAFGPTLWGSFLVDVTVNFNSSASIVLNSTGAQEVTFSANSNSAGFWQLSNGFTSFDSNTPYDPLTLVIFRIDYDVSGNDDHLQVWFNADPATAAPNFNRTDEYGTQQIAGVLFISSSNFDGSSMDIDEIRLGSTMADVTKPVPTPVITSPLLASATVGQPFIYQFEATSASSLEVLSLPPGLAFNKTLSAIVGNPTAPGTFQADLSATNSGGTTRATLTITVQPAPSSGPTILSSNAVTGRTGQPFSFQVITTGGTPSARLSASSLPPGLVADPVSGLISGTPTTDGSFAVTLDATDGGITVTSILQLTFTSDPAIPVIVSSNSATVIPGQSFSYTIEAPANSDPVNDPTVFTLIGTLPSGLTFDFKTGIISGTFNGNPLRDGDPSDWKKLSGGIVGNVQLFATNSRGTSTIPLNFFLAPTGTVNIATRLAVDTGDNVLIGGFIITGNAPKKVIIRAIGPSLRANDAPVPGALQDPTLELHDASGTLGSNDNWRDSQEQEIIDTTIPPTDGRESAVVATLMPGSYTAVVAGNDNTTGIAVVEVYDLGTASLDGASKAQLAQISTRGTVQTNDDVMIGGFILSGTATKVLVRAIGPELNGIVPGALQDTTLELRDGSGSLIFANDDWRTTQEQAIIDTTVPPKDDRESAIVATLNPGPYTAIVRGKDNSTGVALVEVYGLQ